MADPIVEKLENFEAFKVDVFCEDYPDVIFEIILDTTPTQEQIAAVVNTLWQFADRYNRRHFFKPIHYVSDVDSLPDGDHPRGIYVHVDFGNCSPKALIGAIEALAKAELPIHSVALL